MIENNIGLRLAKLRIAKGVSARDMSLSIGQNPGYIFNIESGRANPSIEMLFYICEYLGITVAEFFDDGNAYPEKYRALFDDIKRLNEKQLDTVTNIVREILK